MTTLLAATDLDDACRLARDVSRRGISCLVPLPGGQCWRFTGGVRERQTTSVECAEIPCVILESLSED